MKDLILVFLFTTGQVQYTSFGSETIAVQTLPDSEENKAAFVRQLKEMTDKPNAKVCAVVPTFEFNSPLHKPLNDLLTEKDDKLPGIWEEQKGLQKVLKLKADVPVTIEHAAKFCKLAAPVAFK